ncbi:MAG: hypothetical protein AAF721_13965 [Myxococcota bacterium]
MSDPGDQGGESAREAIRKDLADLRRGALINTLGYAIKIAQPGLLIVVLWLYSKSAYGVLVGVQAVLMLAARVGILGLDKALLWWVPQQEPTHERRAVLGTLVLVTVSTSVVAAALAFAAPSLLGWWIESDAVLQAIGWMAPAIVPIGIMEVFVHASLGKRRMEAQVVVREGIVPLSLLAAALLMYLLGRQDIGLLLAFGVSYVAGAIGAAVVFARNFRGSHWPDRDRFTVPARLVRYGLPMWLAEFLNSGLQRLDVYALTAVADEATLGVYGVVVQVGNVIRMIRRSFDPIVLAIVSSVSGDKTTSALSRLAAGFSHATVLVLVTQLPIFAFLVAFTPWILMLYPEGYQAGQTAILILCGFWAVGGALGLAGIVVAGYGRSGLSLLNTIIAFVLLGGLLALFVEPWGMEGAALSVGLAYTLQYAIMVGQMRWVTGAWNYRVEVLWAVLAGVAGSAAMATAWFVCAGLPPLATRIVAFVAFGVVYGGAVLRMRRAGLLSSGPPPRGPADDEVRPPEAVG